MKLSFNQAIRLLRNVMERPERIRNPEKRKSLCNPVKNEEGTVLVVALLLLVVLTILGISASTTSEIEIQISGNETYHKIAFFNADSAVYTTPKLISPCIDEGAQRTSSDVTYLDAGVSDFYREVMGFNPYDADKDIRIAIGDYTVDVDVGRSRQASLVGGGAEFGAGAEGIGTGATGGVAVYFDMDSLGEGPDSAQSNVLAEYRKVIGVAGGL